MPVTFTAENRILTAMLAGEIDHHRAGSLMGALEREISELLPRTVVLDCSAITFMDSSGIAVLLRVWRRMDELEGGVRLTRVPEQPARVLRAAGIERMIPTV